MNRLLFSAVVLSFLLLAGCDAYRRNRNWRKRGGGGGGSSESGGGSDERGGEWLSNGRCPHSCTSDFDCPSCRGQTSTCDPTTFVDVFGRTRRFCSVPGGTTTTTSTTCSSNADCPLNSFCSNSVCVLIDDTKRPDQYPPCSNTVACVDAAVGLTCNSGVCLQTCGTAAECQTDSLCQFGRCQRTSCASNDDCNANSVCVPFITQGGTTTVDLCTWPIDLDDIIKTCTTDADCGTGASCTNNQCVVSTTSTTGFGVLPTNWCAQVTSNGQVTTQNCPFGARCNYNRSCPYVDGNGNAIIVYTCNHW